MSLTSVSAAHVLQHLDDFHAVIDARSEDEHAEDHLPGAQNWPSLRNSERALIGTLYAQVSPFEAQKRGAALVAANIAQHIDQHVLQLPRGWRPLVYCWRGGKRSGALGHVLAQIGFRVTVLEGGYKAWRRALIDALPELCRGLQFRVVCGPTGSGKTRLLHALREAGAQVLDLEGIACHRSSVLGAIAGVKQPSQRRFESQLWEFLGGFDPDRPVYVESESKKVGNLAVPPSLMDAMRASPCVVLRLPIEQRVALLLDDYPDFVRQPQLLRERLDSLVPLRGRAVVDGWLKLIDQGHMSAVVRDLLQQHYDPGYQQSTRRNYQLSDQAVVVELDRADPDELTRVAAALVGDVPGKAAAVSASNVAASTPVAQAQAQLPVGASLSGAAPGCVGLSGASSSIDGS